MVNPTEIIIYRNPAEKALWDFISTPAGTFIILGVCGILTAGLIFTVVQGLYQNFKMWRRNR
jgi:hypothetical protein